MVKPSKIPSLDLHLSDLTTGFPHIPPECGAVLAQAVVVCLENLNGIKELHHQAMQLADEADRLRSQGRAEDPS